MTKTSRSLLIITAAVTTVAVYFISVYARKSHSTRENFSLEAKRLKVYDQMVYPKAVSVVRTGDMVTRLGSDITSEMIRLLNDSDKSFSHCGIASIENDTVFIYHALGGEFNPDQKLKREPLYSFGHPSENKAIGIFGLGLTNNQKMVLQSMLSKSYAAAIPFDMEFNYKSEDKYYCAEFVAKCFSRSLGDSSWIKFTRRNNFAYLTVEDLCHNKITKEIRRWSY
jgi:hypothetical protein